MGKTRDLFKKIRDTKGKFHAKMGTVLGRNCMVLTKAENIKKSQQEYTELCKKDLNDPENNDDVITSRARYAGVQSQVGLRKRHRTKLMEVMEFQPSYFKS